MSDNKIDRSSNNTANRYQGADGPSTPSRTDGAAEIQSTDAAPDADAASAADSAAIGDSNDALQNSSRRLRQATGPGPSRRKNPWDADIEKNGVAHDLERLMQTVSEDGLTQERIQQELWGDPLSAVNYDDPAVQKQFRELANHPRELRDFLTMQGVKAGKSPSDAAAVADRMVKGIQRGYKRQVEEFGAQTGNTFANKPPAMNLEESDFGRRLEASLKTADPEALDGPDPSHPLDPAETIFDQTSTQQLRRLLSHPKELKTYIAEQLESRPDIQGDWFGDTRQEKIDAIAGRYVKEAETEFIDRAKRTIANRAEKQVDAAIEMNRKLNESPQSRRRFLATIAAQLDGEPEKIQHALQQFGIGPDQTSTMANQLGVIGDDPAKMRQFLRGNLEIGERAEEMLKSALDDSLDQLSDMAFRITHDKDFDNDELLTDPNFKHVRASVFQEMGIDNQLAEGGPMHNTEEDWFFEFSSGVEDGAVTYKNPSSKLMNEKLMSIQETKGREENVVFGLQVVGGLAFGAGGAVELAANIVSGAAGDAAGIGVAHHNTDVARGAKTAGLTDQSTVDAADQAYYGAIGSAVFNAVWAGTGGAAMGKMTNSVDFAQAFEFERPLANVARDQAAGVAEWAVSKDASETFNNAIIEMMNDKPEETPEELQDDVEDMRLKAQQQDF